MFPWHQEWMNVNGLKITLSIIIIRDRSIGKVISREDINSWELFFKSYSFCLLVTVNIINTQEIHCNTHFDWVMTLYYLAGSVQRYVNVNGTLREQSDKLAKDCDIKFSYEQLRNVFHSPFCQFHFWRSFGTEHHPCKFYRVFILHNYFLPFFFYFSALFSKWYKVIQSNTTVY